MNKQYIIKSNVSEENFKSIACKWLSRGNPFSPNALTINSISLIHLPVHYYRSKYSGKVSGNSKIEERNTIYRQDLHQTQMLNRTVNKWIPYSQNISGEVSVVIYVGDAKNGYVRSFIENSDWSSDDLILLNNETNRDSIVINHSKKNLSEVWNDSGYDKSYDKAFTKIISGHPNTLYKNLKPNLKLEISDQFKVITPYWVLFFEYEDKSHSLLVDATNPNRISSTSPRIMEQDKEYLWNIGFLMVLFLASTGATGFYKANMWADYKIFKSIGIFIILFIILALIAYHIVLYIQAELVKKNKRKITELVENTSTTAF